MHHLPPPAQVCRFGADAGNHRIFITVNRPGPDPAGIARDQAATRAAMVLSDLLARADARAGELAKAYDRARIAGLTCEASYTALKEGHKQLP